MPAVTVPVRFPVTPSEAIVVPAVSEPERFPADRGGAQRCDGGESTRDVTANFRWRRGRADGQRAGEIAGEVDGVERSSMEAIAAQIVRR